MIPELLDSLPAWVETAAPVPPNPSPLSEVGGRVHAVVASAWMPLPSGGLPSYRAGENSYLSQLASRLSFAEDGSTSWVMIKIEESPLGVSFAVKVHPRARKNAITGELGDALKVSLTTPPVEGRANEACIEFFAKLLKVPRSSVTIASGRTSRNKVIRVAGVTAQYVHNQLRA